MGEAKSEWNCTEVCTITSSKFSMWPLLINRSGAELHRENQILPSRPKLWHWITHDRNLVLKAVTWRSCKSSLSCDIWSHRAKGWCPSKSGRRFTAKLISAISKCFSHTTISWHAKYGIQNGSKAMTSFNVAVYEMQDSFAKKPWNLDPFEV